MVIFSRLHISVVRRRVCKRKEEAGIETEAEKGVGEPEATSLGGDLGYGESGRGKESSAFGVANFQACCASGKKFAF